MRDAASFCQCMQPGGFLRQSGIADGKRSIAGRRPQGNAHVGALPRAWTMSAMNRPRQSRSLCGYEVLISRTRSFRSLLSGCIAYVGIHEKSRPVSVDLATPIRSSNFRGVVGYAAFVIGRICQRPISLPSTNSFTVFIVQRSDLFRHQAHQKRYH